MNAKIFALFGALVLFWTAMPCGWCAEAPATPIETAAFRALVSTALDPHSMAYEIKPGDNLTKIAKAYHVTPEILMKINQLPDNKLMPGKKIKIPAGQLSVVVDKSQNTLIFKVDEEVLKTYTVSTGANNITPVGVFKITDKLVHPTWYKNGQKIPYGNPKNVLGTRWMGIDKKGYGIHGTVEPEKLGQQVTEGCIRMRNEEVEELYSYLPSGTEVTIVD